ncbi:serine/threonine protein kinase [Gigaspora margarita]|uniref:Serine/threonine protein kinase n=1 Tax=Gigaspora margarita TaxID=4874 RepID=A0A8H3X007_GIGMA|nr:serine/threonine protein kinase [Gigaspora margarita]
MRKKTKKIRKTTHSCSDHSSIYHPINQMYGYICANETRCGVLSTYDQTWFFQRGIDRNNYEWIRVSDIITNVSTDPTLLKSLHTSSVSFYIKKPSLMMIKIFAGGEGLNEGKE